MTTVLQFLTIAATLVALALWGFWRGRKERRAEHTDPRQREMYFDSRERDHENRGAAMSRL
jgi:hypothetical protein